MDTFIKRLQSYFPPMRIRDVDDLKYCYFHFLKKSLLEIFPVEEKIIEKSIRHAFKKITYQRKRININTVDELEAVLTDLIFEFLNVTCPNRKKQFIISVKRKLKTKQAICERHAQKFVSLVLPNLIYITRNETLALSIIYEALAFTEKTYSIKESEKEYFTSASIEVVDIANRYKFFVTGAELRGEIES